MKGVAAWDTRRARSIINIIVVGGGRYFPDVLQVLNIIVFRHRARSKLQYLGFAQT
jgi:hypothetical protein